MHRPRPATLRRASIGLTALLALAGCSAAASIAPSASSPSAPSPSAMVEHSPVPSESAMVEHTATPSPAGPVSQGTFHDVDGTAMGTVALYHNADGTFTITFEDFSIASAAGTNVVLVTNRDVTRDGDVDTSALVDLGPLKGTTGMQDFAVPASADAMTLHTVVLWETGMAHAIAAAPLR